jgi:hypothetical protein
MHDELHRKIAELVADHADRATPPPIAAIRRRGRRHRARLVGVTVCAVVVLLASAVVVPRLLPDRSTSPITRPVPTTTALPTTRPIPAGPVTQVPAGGFEVPLPAGWTARKVGGPPADRGEAIIELVPRRAMSLNAAIVLQTQVLAPEQHPGLPPGEDPGRGGGANAEGLGFYALDDRGSPLGRGRRPGSCPTRSASTRSPGPTTATRPWPARRPTGGGSWWCTPAGPTTPPSARSYGRSHARWSTPFGRSPTPCPAATQRTWTRCSLFPRSLSLLRPARGHNRWPGRKPPRALLRSVTARVRSVRFAVDADRRPHQTCGERPGCPQSAGVIEGHGCPACHRLRRHDDAVRALCC